MGARCWWEQKITALRFPEKLLVNGSLLKVSTLPNTRPIKRQQKKNIKKALKSPHPVFVFSTNCLKKYPFYSITRIDSIWLLQTGRHHSIYSTLIFLRFIHSVCLSPVANCL